MPNLLLFMTPGVGLNTWKQIGIFQRELKLYVEYVHNGWAVKILTFDRENIPDLPEGIQAINFPYRHLLWMLPWSHKELGKWADIMKTNQSHHAYFYSRASEKWKKPLLLRCGYVHGEYLQTLHGSTPKTRLYQWMESRAFRQADRCQVPTEQLSQWIGNNYHLPEEKIEVIPNFADTDIFKPIRGIRKKNNSVISVGRLARVKRFDMLMIACAKIPGCELTLVGEGPEKQNFLNLARNLGLKLNLLGNVPHESLPELLQGHMVFTITSEREGHPKALIEAMASGVPCLGVTSPGINNLIENGKNGLLVESTPESVREGLSELFTSPVLRARLSQNARTYVENNFSFHECFSREYKLIEQLLP